MKIDLMESMSSSSHLFSGAELIISTESGLSVTDSRCKYDRHNPHWAVCRATSAVHLAYYASKLYQVIASSTGQLGDKQYQSPNQNKFAP